VLPDPSVEGDAIHAIAVAGGVECVAPVKEAELGRDHARLGVILQGGDQAFDELGIGLGIVVERDEHLALGCTEAKVVAAGQAQVVVEGQ
jgi:hypothetical protein